MTIANLKPLFVIDDEALSDLQERSTDFECREKRGIRCYNFEINGIHLAAVEQGTGTGRYTVQELDRGMFQVIEGDADVILRHIDRGFPRVSGSFPPVRFSTSPVPTATANDDEDIDAMLAKLGGVDDKPKGRIGGDEDIDAMLAALD